MNATEATSAALAGIRGRADEKIAKAVRSGQQFTLIKVDNEAQGQALADSLNADGYTCEVWAPRTEIREKVGAEPAGPNSGFKWKVRVSW